MEKAAVQGDGLIIPLIDFSKFLTGDAASRTATARAILHGFQTAGFVYLSNIPVGRPAREAAFAASAAFFRLPAERKHAVSWTTPEANRGYLALGREQNSLSTASADEIERLRATAPDIKETLEIGREGVPDHPNRWPDEGGGDGEMAGFRDTMLDFFAQCRELHVEVMRAIAVGMELDERFFDPFVDAGDNTLRLLCYPEVARSVFQRNPGQLRTGAHADYGSITLLFQDNRGGLQVRGPEGTFVHATPIKDTCVVNAGDLLARWSNDAIKSTVHRVVQPPANAGGGEAEEGETYPARYSIAYFCNPNFDRFIEAIPGTYATEADKKYKGINSGEYLAQRLAATNY